MLIIDVMDVIGSVQLAKNDSIERA